MVHAEYHTCLARAVSLYHGSGAVYFVGVGCCSTRSMAASENGLCWPWHARTGVRVTKPSAVSASHYCLQVIYFVGALSDFFGCNGLVILPACQHACLPLLPARRRTMAIATRRAYYTACRLPNGLAWVDC